MIEVKDNSGHYYYFILKDNQWYKGSGTSQNKDLSELESMVWITSNIGVDLESGISFIKMMLESYDTEGYESAEIIGSWEGLVLNIPGEEDKYNLCVECLEKTESFKWDMNFGICSEYSGSEDDASSTDIIYSPSISEAKARCKALNYDACNKCLEEPVFVWCSETSRCATTCQNDKSFIEKLEDCPDETEFEPTYEEGEFYDIYKVSNENIVRYYQFGNDLNTGKNIAYHKRDIDSDGAWKKSDIKPSFTDFKEFYNTIKDLGDIEVIEDIKDVGANKIGIYGFKSYGWGDADYVGILVNGEKTGFYIEKKNYDNPYIEIYESSGIDNKVGKVHIGWGGNHTIELNTHARDHYRDYYGKLNGGEITNLYEGGELTGIVHEVN